MDTRLGTSQLTLFTPEEGVKCNVGSINIFLLLSETTQSFQCVFRAKPQSLEDTIEFQGRYALSNDNINVFLQEIKKLLSNYSPHENYFSSFHFKIFDEDQNMLSSKISLSGYDVEGVPLTEKNLELKFSLISSTLRSGIKQSSISDHSYGCNIL